MTCHLFPLFHLFSLTQPHSLSVVCLYSVMLHYTRPTRLYLAWIWGCWVLAGPMNGKRWSSFSTLYCLYSFSSAAMERIWLSFFQFKLSCSSTKFKTFTLMICWNYISYIWCILQHTSQHQTVIKQENPQCACSRQVRLTGLTTHILHSIVNKPLIGSSVINREIITGITNWEQSGRTG